MKRNFFNLLIFIFIISSKAVYAENIKQLPNFNQLTASQISKLAKDIDLKTAEKIVHYRERYGAFDDIDGLMVIPGINFDIIETNRGKFTFQKQQRIITLEKRAQ